MRVFAVVAGLWLSSALVQLRHFGLQRLRIAARASAKAKAKDEEMAEMVAAIMSAVDEGREEDLKKAGLKVTKRSDLEIMRDNLSNDQILENVLGDMAGTEEQEIMRMLESTHAAMGVVGFDGETGVESELLAEFRAEAVQAMRDLKSSNRSIFDDPGDLGFNDNIPATDPFRPKQGGTERTLSPVVTGGDAPPSFGGRSREWEIDPAELESENESPLVTESAPLANQESGPVDMASMAAIEAEKGLSDMDGSRAMAQQTFAQLLKASMDASEDKAVETEEETRKMILEAAANGDYASLDVKGLLGETLGTLAEQLGIDVRDELGSDKAKQDMQAIMASSMAELTNNMAELDEQSQLLFQKLGNLEEELRKETAAFEEQKSSELEELLGKQATLQNDIESSREQMQATAQQLERLMSNLDENADVLT